VRTLVMALTVAVLPWDVEAQAQRLFENERVVAWRLAPGEQAQALIRDRRLPGVIVTLTDGAVHIVDDVNAGQTRKLAPGSTVVVVAIKGPRRERLETPRGMIPAFPREGATRVVENDGVTVWNVTWTQGFTTPPHFHDKDVVAVYLDAGTVRSIALSGESTATPRAAGDTVFIPRGRAHIEECIAGPRRDIIIELK
jgi:quercetin dioxygenase-like cupin family protein